MAELHVVETVAGPVDLADLGITLPHEHLVVDWTLRHGYQTDPADLAMAGQRVQASIAWRLLDNPGSCCDNARLDNEDAIVAELSEFSARGGRTVIEVSNPSMGRNVATLRRISERTGLNIIAGSGWYVGGFHTHAVRAATVDELRESLVREFTDGVADMGGIRPGVIGEIGVSPSFSEAEKKCLRAAAQAQTIVGAPLFVHLPGWKRLAHPVLDVVMGEGVSPDAIVLCHMDPSGRDADYQKSLAKRGAWLEFDMIGMPFFYPGEGQSPAPEDTARAISGLVCAGYEHQLLLSHDVAFKSMWTVNGGTGFGYILEQFARRLVRHGMSAAGIEDIMTTNVRRLFSAARRSTER